MQLAPGSTVRARARRQIVVDVEEHDGCRSVRLADADGSGEGMTLLHPFDRIDVLPVLDRPKLASRGRVARACAAAVRAAFEAGETRTLVDARVDLLPYQIEPALAVIRGEATRVLLADEVGLGKTIQAGLILAELRARHLLRRALILTPAGLREQWASELQQRFGLEVTTMDGGTLGALQRSLPPWMNVWTLPGLFLASIDLLKRDGLLPNLEHVIWDAVVVDEAHHATRRTDRHEIASLACSRARFVILITATPHNGDRAAFEDLRALGALENGDPPLRVFRRSRADAQANTTDRRTRIVKVGRSDAETKVDDLLRSYTVRVWREAGPDARLAMMVLRKRGLSGAASLARSVVKRIASLAARDSHPDFAAQLTLDFTDNLGGELIEDDRAPEHELVAPGLRDPDSETQLLQDLLAAAQLAERHDSKAARLVAAVHACSEPAIVFTEYRDTLDDLRRRLEGIVPLTVLHGAMMPAERQHAVEAFTDGGSRVLLATDAAAEGLNLQRRCRWIIHYEVPWSPVRIEQRNGRVDRIGQGRRVHAWHLVAQSTEEESVLARVAVRSMIAARDLGDQLNVAAVVFGDRRLELPSAPTAALRQPASSQAVGEAARVALLRRLPRGLAASARPLRARAHGGRRSSVTLVRGRVLDSYGRLASCTCVALHSRARTVPLKPAQKALGRRARRNLAIQAAFAAAVNRRESAIRRLLEDTGNVFVQPSLFDRRVFHDAEHRRRAREAALAELAPHRPAQTTCMVQLSLVGALPVAGS